MQDKRFLLPTFVIYPFEFITIVFGSSPAVDEGEEKEHRLSEYHKDV